VDGINLFLALENYVHLIKHVIKKRGESTGSCNSIESFLTKNYQRKLSNDAHLP
jgi:hypothetical protein